MPGPNDLGFGYTQQSGSIGAVPYAETQSNPIAMIGQLLASAAGNYQQNQAAGAQVAESRERATTMRSNREARQRIGQLITNMFGQNVQVVPNLAYGDENVPSAPTNEQTMDLRRAVAREQMTPENIAQIMAQVVQSGGDSYGGSTIGDLLANVATAAEDPNRMAGFRGTVLSPGQAVTQTGADSNNVFNEAQNTARNDADNATTQRGQDISRRTSIDTANIAAAVDREQIAAQDRTTRATLETARAQRLNQQTVAAAINSVLGIRRGENVSMPAEMRTRVFARTMELLNQSEQLDATTAATMAINELTEQTNHAGAWIPGVGGRRGFSYTEEGRDYQPPSSASLTAPATATTTAPASPTAPNVPAGSTVDADGVTVRDAQGRVIGRLRQ